MPYDMTSKVAGDEISSTYEGRHVECQESDLVHPSHTDGFVDKGDPVVMGNLVGVAFADALAATDIIAVDTEGIWALSVVATDQNGNSAVARGDELFINKSTAIISKNYDKNVSQSFGYALSTLAAGTTGIVAVKVHWNPDDDLEQVGGSAAYFAMADALQHAREYRYRSTKTSGIARLGYCTLALNGAGVSGDVWRRRLIVEAVGVATAMGGHDGIEFDTDGTITGLGVGHRATFMQPNRDAFATIAGGMSELWAEGDSSDFSKATVHSIHRFVMDGDTTGRATAQNVFEFVNLSATQYAANTDTPDHALRCVINGNVRYIMVSEAQS